MKIAHGELLIFPRFLRFNAVVLWYNYTEQSIEQNCEFIEGHLLPLKSALSDSNMIEFYAHVSQTSRHAFKDHSELLEYIHSRLLSICNRSRGYKLKIYSKSGKNSATEIIAPLLQMPAIKYCSNFEIDSIISHGGKSNLPVELISDWLVPPVDGMENDVQNQTKERFLQVTFLSGVQNAREMIDHLKKVCFVFNLKISAN